MFSIHNHPRSLAYRETLRIVSTPSRQSVWRQSKSIQIESELVETSRKTENMKKTKLAAIYFPSWHVDARRDVHLGHDFTEWDLVRAGKPRFDGHYQPIVPELGYTDETLEENMRTSIQLAADAGIDAFLWDWYWYEEADFLNRPLDETFLGMANPGIKFALMWANHTWIDVFPARVGTVGETWWKGGVDGSQFTAMTDVVISRYFSNPAYWRVDGAAWFTIFSLETFVEGIGGLDEAHDALAEFRVRAQAAGAGGIHLNLLGGFDEFTPEQIAALGFNSIGNYGWGDHMPVDKGLTVDYEQWRLDAEARWERDTRTQLVDFVPNATMGWDSTARVHQDDELVVSEWPYLPVVVGNTPHQFGLGVGHAIEFAERQPGTKVVIVNAWNEWTEGSYLEPDSRSGDQHLRALAAAVANARSASADE